MKIFMTGVTGFVGRYIMAIHHDLRCVIRKGEQHEFEDSILVGSIDGNTNWDGCFYGVDAVIHLAGVAHNNATFNKEYSEVNTQGTLHLARTAAISGVKRFVFVSSIGVNGTATKILPFTVDATPHPHNAYSQSKYDAEVGLKQIAKETGLEVVIVRPTLVYGPSAPGNFGALTHLVNKLPALPFGLANNKRDFIAVQNLADLLITCANHPKAAGHTFLASDGESVSTKTFTNAIAKGLNKSLIQIPIPVSLMRFGSKLIGKSVMAEQLLGNLEVDSSNTQEILGWIPPYTMEQAMASLSENKK